MLTGISQNVQNLLKFFNNVGKVAIFSIESDDYVILQYVHSLYTLKHGHTSIGS